MGKNQLHEKLRADERVINLEGVNLRAAAPELIPEPVDLVVADVSFISLTLILPPCMTWLKPGGLAAVLIKPQFEAGREKVGKKGVVTDKAVHMEVVEKITQFAMQTGFHLLGLDFSPIKGPEGNIEYLLYMEKENDLAEGVNQLPVQIADVVEKAHGKLDE